MWVWPQLPFGGAPPKATGGPFTPRPPSLFPNPPGSFRTQAGVREAAHGGGGGAFQAALGARPTSGGIRVKKVETWKRLKGTNPDGKNNRKLLRRKQSSAKISKISRNTLKSSQSDIFYLLKDLLQTFFSSAKFSEVFALRVFALWLFPRNAQ